jgi:hypothetical protein
MVIAGLFLIVAAVLKAHQMVTTYVPTFEDVKQQYLADKETAEAGEKGEITINIEFWEFLLIAIPLEFGLGVWLCCGIFRKAGWILGVLTFAFFTILTLYKAVKGQTSCGCFGTVEVDPWITLFAIDIPIFLLLIIFWPRKVKLLPPPWPHGFHCLVVAIPACLIMGAMVPTMYYNKQPKIEPEKWKIGENPFGKNTPKNIDNKAGNNDVGIEIIPKVPDKTTQTQQTNIPDVTTKVEDTNETPVVPPIPDVNNTVEIVEPKINSNESVQNVNAMVNDANLPEWAQMVAHSGLFEELLKDTRIAVFYHYECDDCEVAIPLYNKYSADYAADDSIQFAFVSGPPHAPEGEELVPDDTTALIGKLDDSRDWIFESPIVLLLSDGQLLKWWQAENYPDMEQILEAMTTAQ